MGDPECSRSRSAPTRRSGRAQVRIDVAAAGINFADVMARMGLYPDAPKTPCVVGYEVAGTVLRARRRSGGPPARRNACSRGTQFGGYASQVVVPADDVVALPDRLTFEQGAAIPVNYATAWAGLLGYGSLRAGERVLVHSAGGGVGIAATQIAKRCGSRGLRHRLALQARAHAPSSASITPLDYTRSRLGARRCRRST